eukprot:CAMPEP_0119120874 /NCGR_PEP_ID=MMETSP1310-20130426/1738_1 /TAXON_ID=464262 /ORGANISM="Genus nov. species nov., Strain RCC2339" /LENGTH=897 /DNA_ID=CAMNT_0007110385 /DNA_START=42 /DNA_END=2732 /DNA_ORIENTATION=-
MGEKKNHARKKREDGSPAKASSLKKKGGKGKQKNPKNAKVETTEETVTEEELAGAPWYSRAQMLWNAAFNDEERQPMVMPKPVTPSVVQAKRGEAERALEEVVQQQREKKKKGKRDNSMWLETISKGGVTSDKMAAITLLIQDDPISNHNLLDSLMSMARRKVARGPGLIAFHTLKDLFLSVLLPSDRLLVDFRHRPLQANAGQRLLALWYYEDRLKSHFSEFVDLLREASKDGISHFRISVLQIVSELVESKPEQERALISLLVNKVGDVDKKVGGKAVYCLTKLLEHHPNMKLALAKEIEIFLARPNLSLRSQHYAVCFLNQITLSRSDHDLCGLLLVLYFALFRKIVAADKDASGTVVRKSSKKRQNKKSNKEKEKTEISPESRILSALLIGVSRVFPFAPTTKDLYEGEVDILFRLLHETSFARSAQILMLLFQIMEAQHNIQDRFYRAVYGLLLSPELYVTTRVFQFFNTLFKALQVDRNKARIAAFVKRLLAVAAQQTAAFACAALYLTSELIRAKPWVFKLMVYAPEEGVIGRPGESEGNWQGEKENDGMAKYDPTKREPKFSGADVSMAWEMDQLRKHYHPSVRKWAETVLSGQPIHYDGDPLLDFALISFLDRFSFKNPKERRPNKPNRLRRTAERFSLIAAPMNTGAFYDMPEDSVREEELFAYRYFQKRPRRKARGRDADDSEEDEEAAMDAALEAEMADELGDPDMDDSSEEELLGSAVESDGGTGRGGENGGTDGLEFTPPPSSAESSVEESAADSDGGDSSDGRGRDFDMVPHDRDTSADASQEADEPEDSDEDVLPFPLEESSGDDGEVAAVARNPAVETVRGPGSAAMFMSAQDFENLMDGKSPEELRKELGFKDKKRPRRIRKTTSILVLQNVGATSNTR